MPAKPELSELPMFFIIGRPRSGTTLLSLMFDAHPQVVIPGECNFILALSGKYKNISTFDKETRLRFVADLKLCRYYDTLAIDEELLQQKILSLPEKADFAELCRQVQLCCPSVHQKSEILITGDKNPSYSSENFRKIFRLFPDARYIHLIRDYRDHIASMLQGNFRQRSPTYLAIVWKRSIRMMRRYKKKYPDNFYTIRYEDLVLQPEKHLKEICVFLGIPYCEEMFSFYQKKEAYLAQQPNIFVQNHHQSLFNPVNQSRIGKWQELLSGNELSAVEVIAGKTGKALGYTPTRPKITPKVFTLVARWRFMHFLVIILRGFVFSLPVKKRRKTSEKIKTNKLLLRLYFLFDRSKPV